MASNYLVFVVASSFFCTVVVYVVVLYENTVGMSRGFGFVTLSYFEEFNVAVSTLDGFDMDGRPLQVIINSHLASLINKLERVMVFGFVTMENLVHIEAVVEKFNGYELNGRRVNSRPPPLRENSVARSRCERHFEGNSNEGGDSTIA
eukprot:Gb_16256 [translate_table: standard]